MPLSPSLQALWIFRALKDSTKGFSRPGLAMDAARHVFKILTTMVRGREKEHLNELINLVDFRGSDVRLLDGSVCEGSRQTVPYPAVVWDWKCVQSYAWASEQHINVLELVAFLNYYRCMSAFTYNHSLRFSIL